MKKTFIVLFFACICARLLGAPAYPFPFRIPNDPGYELAEYKRLPMEKRIARLQRSGEDLFKRRRYEDSIKVFDTILKLKKHDLKASLWITKAKYELRAEENEAAKERLYKENDGYLIPKDKIYGNWNWPPSIGHFEVRYSKPKPRPVYEKKIRPRATDAQLKEALVRAENSGSASDTFELAMLHWSRKDRENALKFFYKAFDIDPEILILDDEELVTTVLDEIDEKVSNGQAKSRDYFDAGKLNLIQGDRGLGLVYLMRASDIEPKFKPEVDEIFEAFVSDPNQTEWVSYVPEIDAYRQAYVYDSNADWLYIRIVGSLRVNVPVFFIDLSIPTGFITNKAGIPESRDIKYCFFTEGVDGAARLWCILPERKSDDFNNYDVMLKVKLNRKAAGGVLDFSNYAMSDIYDNWSFVIGQPSNFRSMQEGVAEYMERGIKVSAFHLYIYEGKGPSIRLSDFTENIPYSGKSVDIWSLMEPVEYTLPEPEPEPEIASGAAPVASDTMYPSDVMPGMPYDSSDFNNADSDSHKDTQENRRILPSSGLGNINMDIGL